MPETFSLWQLPEQTLAPVMSYLIRSVNGRLIVVDGGTDRDADYLRELMRGMGNEVDTWFVSHPHTGHVGALISVLRDPRGISIGRICAALPDPGWAKWNGSGQELALLEELLAAIDASGVPVENQEPGGEMSVDGIRIEILSGPNSEITRNAINNSSLVWRMSDQSKSVLFTGDLGREGGKKLLASPMAERLPSVYCQMAHHGESGVGQEFYQRVNPTYCLWPTPLWLWENDSGEGHDSGPWETLLTRAWMVMQPVKEYILAGEGLRRID